MTTPPLNGTEQDSWGAERDEIGFREYWRVLVRRRNVVLTCLVVTVLTVMFLTLLSTPEYVATTTLQIERQGPEILNFKDILGYDPAGYQDFYETQYKILQSRRVRELTVERLDLANLPEFLARKGSPVSRGLRWIKSSVKGAPDEDLHKRAVRFVENNLSIDLIRNSYLVRISFMDRDPELARDVANAVADAYQQFKLDARFNTTDQASEFLTKEVARVRQEIGALERRLLEYGDEKAILAMDGGTRGINEQTLADLSARLTVARTQLAKVQAKYDEIQDSPPDSVAEVLSSPLIHQLKQQVARLEREHSQMRERFKPGWPALAELEEGLAQVRAGLEFERQAIAKQVRDVSRNNYEQALAEVSHLEGLVDAQYSEVQQNSRDAIEYGSLKAEIDAQGGVLTGQVTRRSETETAGQLRGTQPSNVRVVDRAATPDEPARPRKLFNLGISVLVGLMLGVGIVLVSHYVDNTIKTEQEIIHYGAGAAVLGHIPFYDDDRDNMVHASRSESEKVPIEIPGGAAPDLASQMLPRSSFAEAFRNLRTSLLLAVPDHPPRQILVTSCGPGDGKSTVALNLSTVLTQLGRRVLLIDADLRRSRIHKALGLDNKAGLSNLLSGNAHLGAIIRECRIPSLDVITGGPIPPNPSELLGSPALDALLTDPTLTDGYDHVIFDSPPATQVADAVILAAKMDSTILVVRAGGTTRDSLAATLERLRRGHAHALGTLLNAVSERTGYYYYDRYRYYSGSDDSESAAPSESSAAGPLALSIRWKRRRRRAG
ncbi:MAG: polysaccharide biosynthesis tyrosine autokinase [Acidobacteria bacterium]|nr:polysaccharide biosynthesis tyrosine autokinase [Acidobacteriota bacterium]